MNKTSMRKYFCFSSGLSPTPESEQIIRVEGPGTLWVIGEVMTYFSIKNVSRLFQQPNSSHLFLTKLQENREVARSLQSHCHGKKGRTIPDHTLEKQPNTTSSTTTGSWFEKPKTLLKRSNVLGTTGDIWMWTGYQILECCSLRCYNYEEECSSETHA